MQDIVEGLKDKAQDAVDAGSEAVGSLNDKAQEAMGGGSEQTSLEETAAGKQEQAQQMADDAEHQVQHAADASQSPLNLPDTLRLYKKRDVVTGMAPKMVSSMAMFLCAALAVGGV